MHLGKRNQRIYDREDIKVSAVLKGSLRGAPAMAKRKVGRYDVSSPKEESTPSPPKKPKTPYAPVMLRAPEFKHSSDCPARIPLRTLRFPLLARHPWPGRVLVLLVQGMKTVSTLHRWTKLIIPKARRERWV